MYAIRTGARPLTDVRECVDGTLLAIELNRDGTQTPAELEEAWAIVESLQITR